MNSLELSRLTTRQRGVWGEAYICSLLHDCINVNVPKEQHLPYDLIWDGIKINVKLSSTIKSNGSYEFQCGFDDTSGVIFVCVAIFNDVPRFWVYDKVSGGKSANLYHSLPKKYLRKSILDKYRLSIDNYVV